MTKLKGIFVVSLFLSITLLTQKIAFYMYSLIIFKLAEANWPILSLVEGEITKEEKAMGIINDTQVLHILLGWFLCLGLIYGVFRLSKQEPLEKLKKKLGVINFLCSIIIGLGLVLLTNGALNMINTFVELPAIDYGFEASIIKGLFLFGIVGVLTPLAEEIMYRGLIMGKLLEGAQSVVFAVLFQAIVFSASHLEPVQSFFVFPLGLMAGLAVARTKSIASGFVIHISFNLANLYFLQSESFYANIGQLIVLFVLGLFLCNFGYGKLIAGRNER